MYKKDVNSERERQRSLKVKIKFILIEEQYKHVSQEKLHLKPRFHSSRTISKHIHADTVDQIQSHFKNIEIVNVHSL